MQGRRGRVAELLQPLGRPPGRRGQRHLQAALVGEPDQGGDRAALAGARPAGQHADPVPQDGPDGAALGVVQVAQHRLVVRTVERLGGGGEAGDRLGHRVLGRRVPLQAQHRPAVRRPGGVHDAGVDRGGDGGRRVGDALRLHRGEDQVLGLHGVPVPGRPVQRVGHQRPAAARVVPAHPGQRGDGDPVGLDHPDVRQLQQPPRVVGEAAGGVVAEGVDGPRGDPGPQPGRHHQPGHLVHVRDPDPAGQQPAGADPPDLRQRREPLGGHLLGRGDARRPERVGEGPAEPRPQSLRAERREHRVWLSHAADPIRRRSTNPAVVLQASVPITPGRDVYVSGGDYVFPAGFSSILFPADKVFKVMCADDAKFIVPNGYADAVFKFKAVNRQKFFGGRFEEAGTPARNWYPVELKADGPGGAFTGCLFNIVGGYETKDAKALVKMGVYTNDAWLNGNTVRDLTGWRCKYVIKSFIKMQPSQVAQHTNISTTSFKI